MSSTEPDPNEEPAEEPAEEGDPEPAPPVPPRKRLAALQRGKLGKPVQPEFKDELDENYQATFFTDKRYETARKQLAFGVAGLVAAVLLLAVLFWPRESAEVVDAPFPQPAPAATPTPPPVLTPEQIRLAELDERRGQLQQAVDSRDWPEIEPRARQVLEMMPDDGEAWHAIGWVQERNGDAVAATASYGKAIAGGFLPAHTHLKRAAMYRLQGKYAEAIGDLEEAGRLDPESMITPNLLMITQIQAGRADAVRSAVEGFEKTGIVANSDRYLLGKAALLLHDGDFEGAAETLADFQSRVPAALFAVLAQDRYFDAYRSDAKVQGFLILP